MKKYLSLFFAVSVLVSSVFATVAGDRFSLKDFKKALKRDSSAANNSQLAKEVVRKGVTFEYTRKREKDLRNWGANDELIDAIYQSIVDESDEERWYRDFMKKYKSPERDTRKAAMMRGRQYLGRFEMNSRFAGNVSKIKEEIKYLECEFNPDLGC